MTTITVRPRDVQAIIDATFPNYRGPHARVEVRAPFLATLSSPSQITVEGRNALESLPADRKVML